MSTQLKLRRGTTAQHSTFTGAEGEVTVDTTKDTLVVHDGTTAGGVPLSRESALTSGLAGKQPLASELTAIAAAGNAMFKNRIINGAMVIDQRNAGASVSTPANYSLDRWKLRYSAGTCTVQRSTTAPAGFNNSFQLTVGTARTVVSGDRFGVEQPIEGYNMADFGWGTANAQPVTLSFWVRSSLTGTFGLCFSNFSRGYAATYTINAANTYEYKTVTIAGDTSGTWDTTNGTGVLVVFDLGMGSDVRTTTGSWQAGTFLGATGATNLVSTAGAIFYITGVQLEKGSTATSFDYRPYGTELGLCQRYYTKSFAVDVVPSNLGTGAINTTCTAFSSGGAYVAGIFPYPATMRAIPTVVFYSGGNSGGSGVWDIYQGVWSATNATTLNIPSSTHLNLYVGSSGMTTWYSYLVAGAFTASAEL